MIAPTIPPIIHDDTIHTDVNVPLFHCLEELALPLALALALPTIIGPMNLSASAVPSLVICPVINCVIVMFNAEVAEAYTIPYPRASMGSFFDSDVICLEDDVDDNVDDVPPNENSWC